MPAKKPRAASVPTAELPGPVAAELIALPEPDFDKVYARLATLSRNHLLFFRLEVGRTLAHDFYANQRAAYHHRAPNKDNAFRRFVTERASDLADLGLNEALLRSCLLAWWAVADLPEAVAHSLKFSHVLTLARVDDAATRLLLAEATLRNRWSGDALEDAVAAVRDGRWIDAEPEKPGLQPAPAETLPDPEPPARAAQPGRVVNRFEKTAVELHDLASQWETVDVEHLTAVQKRRTLESVAQIKAHIARVEARLQGG